MTDLAATARDNALQLEVKKDGLQQRQSGDWVLRFTVQGIDMPEAVMKAAMGTRYVCVLVELNDDETPKVQETTEQPRPPAPQSTKGGAKSASQIAGYLCTLPPFWNFLNDEWRQHGDKIKNADEAAMAVRHHCNVLSRSELTNDNYAWRDLVERYRAWEKEVEVVG